MLGDKARTHETSVYRMKYKQEMLSSALVNYGPDTGTGDSEGCFQKVECLSPSPFLNALSEAEAERRKVRFCCKGNLYIAASPQFSVTAFSC